MSGYELGERVYATIGVGGLPRCGVVTAILNAGESSYAWNGERRYMVKFDREAGISGPCVVFRAEGGREAESSSIGTAA